MEAVVREILAELAVPTTLAFPDRDAEAHGSRPFYMYCDSCIDGFDAALEQEQPDGSVRSMASFSRAALDSERRWTPPDSEAGTIVGANTQLHNLEDTYGVRTFSIRSIRVNLNEGCFSVFFQYFPEISVFSW